MFRKDNKISFKKGFANKDSEIEIIGKFYVKK